MEIKGLAKSIFFVFMLVMIFWIVANLGQMDSISDSEVTIPNPLSAENQAE